MSAVSCETCARLRELVDYWKRVDYRTWREAAAELLRHQLGCHIWHVATVEVRR